LSRRFEVGELATPLLARSHHEVNLRLCEDMDKQSARV